MTTLADHREHSAPSDLLSALRTGRAAGADALAATRTVPFAFKYGS